MVNLSRLKLAVPITNILLSCCLCVYLLELIISELPGAGNIITLAQFLFISLEGLIFERRFGFKRRSVPLKHYLMLVIIFFLVSVSNNFALKFNISMPLHMIFKSGSLISNMALGILILNKKYDWTKYLAVGLISVGIGISTLASTGGTGMAAKQLLPDDEAKSNWFMGICLLTFSLIASSRMGIYQETLYKKYGKHPREALFYCHALPLPGFLMLYKDIYAHAVAFTASQPIDVPLVFATVPIPKHWVYLALIAVAQYVCARSIFTLTTECSSLAVTLVITIRKFVSLVISIFIFKNPFTLVHWSGAMLVFLGTFVFVDFPFSLFRKKKSHSD